MSGHSAPGQAAGYYFQLERAMARLADTPDADAIIAVEKEDDVSVRLSNGGLYVEQDKHSISDRCPFSDSSPALWKTLDIWTGLAESGELDPAHSRYFLVTNVRIPEGLARAICNATEDTVAACLERLKKAAAKVPASVKTFAEPVIGRDPAILRSVVLRAECVDASDGASGVELRRIIASRLHLPDDVPDVDVLNQLLGWIANELLTAWRDGKPGLISRRSFDRQLHRHLELFRRYRKFGLPEHLVHFAKDEIQKHRKRRYVKQLAAVTSNFDETIEAITDFVRCSTERFRLATEGELTGDDWTDFESGLIQSWKTIFRRYVRILTNEPEQIVGYRILCDTREVTTTLGSQPAHRYFVMGTYHRFADEKIVGWHPRYVDLIK